MDIRPAQAADLAAITALHDAAFGTPGEGQLVTDLTKAGLAILSLVAQTGTEIAGHILFSPLLVETDRDIVLALALAPVAVSPARQGQGIGTSLVKRGLDAARAEGWEAVIVLGHPAYYRRFGFSPEPIAGFRGPFEGPAYMGLELRPGTLSHRNGRIIYPSAFGLPEEAPPIRAA